MRDNLTEIIALYSDKIPESEFKGVVTAIKAEAEPLQTAGEEFRFTVASFGTNGANYKKLCENASDCRIAEKKFPCGKKSYQVALVDSATLLAQEAGVRYCGTPEIEIPSRIVFVMIVFGKDNASKKYTYDSLREVVEHQSYVYKWEFFMITDDSSNAERLAIPEDNVVLTTTDTKGYFCESVKELSRRIMTVKPPAVPEVEETPSS
jgi:hypothetical protein